MDTSPKPPALPSIDRTTGKVTLPRPEDNGTLDGWASSENCWEGGLTAVHQFNSQQPEDARAADAAEFNERGSNSVI